MRYDVIVGISCSGHFMVTVKRHLLLGGSHFGRSIDLMRYIHVLKYTSVKTNYPIQYLKCQLPLCARLLGDSLQIQIPT